MSVLSPDVRLEVNALLERLLDNDVPSFDVETAQRLISLIPCEKKRSWFNISGLIQGGVAQTQAQPQPAGIGGKRNLSDDTETREFDFSGHTLWRVGGYKLVHEPELMTITLMLDVNPLEREECYLVYDHPNQPKALFLAQPRDYQLSFFGMKIGVRVISRILWKRPHYS